MGEFMTFSTYYLWQLIDDFKFEIDDVAEMAVFYRTDCFGPWYDEMIKKRIDFMSEVQADGTIGNRGGEQFCKMVMNSSYGFDGLNEEKFNKTALLPKNRALMAQARGNHVNSRKINDNFTFDNAK
jgi:hypothetical protein